MNPMYKVFLRFLREIHYKLLVDSPEQAVETVEQLIAWFRMLEAEGSQQMLQYISVCVVEAMAILVPDASVQVSYDAISARVSVPLEPSIDCICAVLARLPQTVKSPIYMEWKQLGTAVVLSLQGQEISLQEVVCHV